MEGGESPLEVLSRAATMVQENQQALSSTDDTKTSTKQLPTSKWKRDRRLRLPEYTRKVEPPLTPPLPSPPPYQRSDAPLDMSVRQRGLPPSYSQTVSSPGYRSGFKAGSKEEPSASNGTTSISMCDPIIDEHFRRSLGEDYMALFSPNQPKEAPRPKTPPRLTTATTVIELMDSGGLSVDDHFAKALGDTWHKLNSKESAEIKSNTSDNASIVSI